MILIFSYTWPSMHYADDELCCNCFFFLACRLFIGVCIRLCFCLLKMLLMNAMWIVVAKY
jgi:hypothetical protein